MSEAKFKKIVSELRKEVFDRYPELNGTISREKRKIKTVSVDSFYRSKAWKVFVTPYIELTATENKTFVLCGYELEETKENVAKILLEILKKEKKEHVVCVSGEKNKWYSTDQKTKTFIEEIKHYPLFILLSTNEILFNGETNYNFSLNTEENRIELTAKNRVEFSLEKKILKCFYSLEEIDEFVVERAYRNRKINEARDELERFLREEMKFKEIMYGLFFEICDEKESVYLNCLVNGETGEEEYIGNVLGTFYKEDNLERLVKKAKELYKDYYYKNRILSIVGEKEKQVK